MPLRHWFGNSANVENLRALLTDPVFELAVATARATYAPNAASLQNKDPNQLAVAHAYYAGFCDFVDTLHLLTVMRNDTPQAAEWDYVS
jgi:hypothetical protein